MSAYGDVSILAVKRCKTGKGSSPVDAWESAVAEIFPVSMSLQKKACPRGAFLGLCEDGLVSGIARGHYTKSKRNKEYALKATGLLRDDPTLANNTKILWNRLFRGRRIRANGQMEVVTALWNAGLISSGATSD